MTVEILSEIQAAVKAPKNQYNEFNDFYYRSCGDILEGVKPLLQKYKAAILLTDEIVNIGDRFYIKATASLKDDESEISVTAYAREETTKKGFDGSQITGAASSYARKYALNGLFAIDDTKDADSQNNADTTAKTANTNRQTGKAEKAATSQTISFDEASNHKVTLKGNVYKIGDMTNEQLTWLIGKADGELKACAEIVKKRRLADERAKLQEFDGELPFPEE